MIQTREEFIRYEDEEGIALFWTLHDYEWYLNARAIRVPRKLKQELFTLIATLFAAVPHPPPSDAFCDRFSRRPVTWFRSSASEVIQLADRVVEKLNRLGANIWKIRTVRLPAVLWQDEVQVVTRAPRRPRIDVPDLPARRHLNRRKKLQRIRQRASRNKVRRSKSGL